MHSGRLRLIGAGASILSSALLGCGSTSEPVFGSGTGGTASGPFGTSSGPTTTSTSPSSPSPALTLDPNAGTGTGVTPGSACVGTTTKAALVPLDLHFMVDISASMLRDTSTKGVTKWDAVRNALKGFVQEPASDGIGVGL
ncbi:MAG: hypothetical protein SFV15_04850 [Polyangiaceae bacterium]|nr:hypothetical protein [Polyangiaceae bacterium]